MNSSPDRYHMIRFPEDSEPLGEIGGVKFYPYRHWPGINLSEYKFVLPDPSREPVFLETDELSAHANPDHPFLASDYVGLNHRDMDRAAHFCLAHHNLLQ